MVQKGKNNNPYDYVDSRHRVCVCEFIRSPSLRSALSNTLESTRCAPSRVPVGAQGLPSTCGPQDGACCTAGPGVLLASASRGPGLHGLLPPRFAGVRRGGRGRGPSRLCHHQVLSSRPRRRVPVLRGDGRAVLGISPSTYGHSPRGRALPWKAAPARTASARRPFLIPEGSGAR